MIEPGTGLVTSAAIGVGIEECQCRPAGGAEQAAPGQSAERCPSQSTALHAAPLPAASSKGEQHLRAALPD